MTTTFDRYLLTRFFHVFAITFVSLFGLYVVIDAFTNADDFLERPGGVLAVLWEIGRYYSYRIPMMFDRTGGIVSVLSAMVTFSLLQRYGELNPILSAGVPTYRLVAPVLWGALLVDAGMACNRELLIPRIAHHLQISPGVNKAIKGEVETQYDQATLINISARQINLLKQSITDAEFVLPTGETGGQIVDRPTTLRAGQATYLPRAKSRPNGWLLKGVDAPYDSLPLTPVGRRIVLKTQKTDELFVASDITFEHLAAGDRNFELLSTWELMRQIRSPSYSKVSIKKKCLHLHSRITRPILDLLTVLLGLPLVARRGTQSLIGNLAVCSLVLGSMFGVEQLFGYLGAANLIKPDLAAWAPVIVTGTLGVWVKEMVKT